jgi:hypothetical protein
VAGKPEPPLLHEAIARVGSDRPVMIGDRLDTDISAGTRIGIPTLLVFTGVTTIAELLGAIPHERPDYLAYDLRCLALPYPEAILTVDQATCGRARAVVRDGTLDVEWPGGSDPWDAVRAAARLSWACLDGGVALDLGAAAERLTAAALHGHG